MKRSLGRKQSIAILILCLVILAAWAFSFAWKAYRTKPEPVAYLPEKSVRLIEGWTNEQVAVSLSETMGWAEPEVLAFLNDPGADFRAQFSFLGEEDESLEGYLFPDTYRVYASSSLAEVTTKLLDNFDRKLSLEMRQEIARQGRTIRDVVIMASIVEKEAPLQNSGGENRDARLIAGIFWDRLKYGQALQSDATLSYVLKDNKPGHSGQELEVSSPYNTYKYRGLPPGPIANPGLEAIKAAVYPIYSEYNYFLTDSQRRVYYAETYAEHLRNKNLYLK